jgi:GrpB-like predicted nucleotidyltransferase (UPF0157 family)/RimJ/RimL family protein N-acetyltransferase
VLETRRLILRPFKESDVEAAHVWFSDPQIFRFYTYGPYSSLEETAERIRQYMLHFEKHRFTKCIVLEKSTGTPIGDAGLSFDEDMGEVHVGYKFARSHWGLGYATEAAQAWVRYGFDQLGLNRIAALVHPQNAASIRVIQKLQFRLSTYKRADRIDWEIHELLRADDERHLVTENQLRKATIGEPKVINSSIAIIEYDAAWPTLFALEADRIRAALDARVLRLEHVGSTSVPGLAAKPIIDILLVVLDTRDEAAYVPDLERVGYVLKAREPDWHEHRFFKGPVREINLHCFSDGCPEIERMLVFRDWLRSNECDRLLYERTKRGLAGQTWKYVQNYADAKTTIVEEILTRATKAGVIAGQRSGDVSG